MTARATVVITTRDRPGYAQSAIRSALAQTIGDVEVVVVDDASTPPFAPATDDPRVRLLRRDSAGGMCAARNEGLRIASGEWIVFLDDDDELDAAMLERALCAAGESTLPAPVALMTGMRYVTPEGRELEVCHPPTLPRGAHYFLTDGGFDFRAKNALVMPTDVVREIGGWDPQFEAFEADDFGIRLNRVASIQGLDEPLYSLTHHEAPRLTTRSAAIPRDMKRTIAKHREVFLRHRARSAHYMSTIGMYDLRSGRWGPAVWWCLRGVVRDPSRRRNWGFLAAAVAGPYALGAYRWLKPPGATVSTWTLTRRRARKYGGRLVDYPRAAAAVPVARLAQRLIRRRLPVAAPEHSRSVMVCCVYRAANAPIVASILERPRALGWGLRLWALDRVDPSLAPYTVGCGGGAKFPLLNDLIRAEDLDDLDWLVVTDDDLAFEHGSIADLLAVAEAASLDFVQPAHTELSFREHEFTRRRPFALARRTTFVEIGPLFAVRGPCIDHVTPFPAGHSMGWGLELAWSDLAEEGMRIGIVDAVPIRHLQRAGRGYQKRDELDRLNELLRERGLSSLRDIQRVVGTWYVWTRRPPWSEDARARPTREPRGSYVARSRRSSRPDGGIRSESQ